MAVTPEKEFTDLEDLLGSPEEGIELVEQAVMDPTVPFWRIPKKDLQNVLKTAKDIAQRNTDQVSRSVFLKQEAGELKFYITNKDIYFSGSITLKNDQNVMEAAVVLSVKQLDDIAKFSVDVVIYKEGDIYHASLMRGVQPLDVFAFPIEIYSSPVAVGSAPFVDVEASELKRQMEIFAGLMSLASVAEDRKIIVKGGKAYGNFVSVAARTLTELPNLVIKSSDARDLLGILSGLTGSIRVAVSKDRAWFVGDKFDYSSFLLSAAVPKELEEKFEVKKDSLTVDGNHFFNLFAYMSTANSDAATARMAPDVEGLKISCKNKFGVVNSFLVSSETLVGLDFDVQIVPTRNIFRILHKYPTVMISKPLEGFVRFETGENLVVLQGVRG